MFLADILPDEGQRCVIAISQGEPPRQRFFATNEEAAQAALHISKAGRNAFFGCATFNGNSRRAEDAVAVKSFWLDIDCGEGKPYPTWRAGLAALKEFLLTTGLVKPRVVMSGAGLHLYWILDEAITPDEWLPVAKALKAATKALAFHADPSRTSDIASILRPVGTLNYKRDPAVEVVQLIPGDVTTLEMMRGALAPWMGTVNPLSTAGLDVTGLNGLHDLSAGLEYPPVKADLIASKCGVIAHLRDTRGNVDQPTWYHSIGVVAFAEDGDEKCHEWSSGHPDYSVDETDQKIAQARKFKPTTCAKLAEFQPDICAACPLNGKINSPISLGSAPIEVPITAEAFGEEEPEPLEFPYGFSVRDMFGRPHLCCASEDDNGVEQWKPFCRTIFYPVVKMVGAECEVEIEVVSPHDGSKRRFPVQTGLVAGGGREMMVKLGKESIMPMRGQKPIMEHYLSEWIDKMNRDQAGSKAHRQFGWNDEEFVLGDSVFTPTGSQPSRLARPAKDKGLALTPTGNLDTWKMVIDKAYNHEGMEPFQYMILAGFAAPLFALLGYGGVTVYAHSEGSGAGKTTAQEAALSIWGNHKDLKLADGQFTINSLWALVGAYNSLPIVIDEMTNMQTSKASQIIFDVSNGRAKQRLTQEGNMHAANSNNWATIVMASGNNLLSEKVMAHRANAEAEIARLFEFTVEKHPTLDPTEASELFPLLLENYGWAGEEFIKFVVVNREKVYGLLKDTLRRVNTEMRVNQVERYWAALQASVITACRIANKLELVRFNRERIEAWISGQMEINRGTRIEANTEPMEIFGRMLAEMWTGVLVTEGEGSRQVPATVLAHPRTSFIGRAILPKHGAKAAEDNPVLLLSSQAIKGWCTKHGVSAAEVRAYMVRQRMMYSAETRMSLGKGTSYYATSAAMKCWHINLRRVSDVSDRALPLTQLLTAVENPLDADATA
jgi:hypothetical protein